MVLERPTAFTLAELAPPFAESVFAEHTVFLGGEVRGMGFGWLDRLSRLRVSTVA